jgi:hypothetical protein
MSYNFNADSPLELTSNETDKDWKVSEDRQQKCSWEKERENCEKKSEIEIHTFTPLHM